MVKRPCGPFIHPNGLVYLLFLTKSPNMCRYLDQGLFLRLIKVFWIYLYTLASPFSDKVDLIRILPI